MDRLKIPKSRLAEWLGRLQAQAAVYAPVEQVGVRSFRRLASGEAPGLECGNTDTPMKEVLFPPTERLVTWQRTPDGLQVTEADTAEPTVIFGARPCDVTGLTFLDRAFRLGGIEDPYWVRRRDQTTVVSLCCPHPVPGCFGPSAGVNETSPEGADVVLTEIDEAYVVEVKSERGQAAIDAAKEAFTPTTEGDLAAAQQAGETLLAELAEQAINLDEPEARAQEFLQSAAWEQVWNRCLSCGICAFLCPTCHCFDICDQSCRGGGERIRCYDTCSSKIYTKQAGGHNARPTARERLTQRVMHKFSYGPQRLGVIGCVGCGRCRRCPVDIDLQMELSEVRG
jgi:ferredoxin